jgi:hypothetical protein
VDVRIRTSGGYIREVQQRLPVIERLTFLPAGLALGGARHVTENSNASGVDGWLGGDFNCPHT